MMASPKSSQVKRKHTSSSSIIYPFKKDDLPAYKKDFSDMKSTTLSAVHLLDDFIKSGNEFKTPTKAGYDFSAAAAVVHAPPEFSFQRGVGPLEVGSIETSHAMAKSKAIGISPRSPPLKTPRLENGGRTAILCPGVGTFQCEDIMEYAIDIYCWKTALQDKYIAIQPLNSQSDITAEMRYTVLKWLVAVNRQFDFTLETWCLTVNILDRFLCIQPMKRDCLQLAGLTSFFIASKLEEVDPPEIPELVSLCANSYDLKQFRSMEYIILSHLKFNFLAPTASYFLVHLIEVSHLSNSWPTWLSRVLIERILCDYHLSYKFKPRSIANAIFKLLAHSSSESIFKDFPKSYFMGNYHENSQFVEECFKGVLRNLERNEMDVANDSGGGGNQGELLMSIGIFSPMVSKTSQHLDTSMVFTLPK